MTRATIILHCCPTCQHLFWEHEVCTGLRPHHPPAETVAVEYREITADDNDSSAVRLRRRARIHRSLARRYELDSASAAAERQFRANLLDEIAACLDG